MYPAMASWMVSSGNWLTLTPKNSNLVPPFKDFHSLILNMESICLRRALNFDSTLSWVRIAMVQSLPTDPRVWTDWTK